MSKRPHQLYTHHRDLRQKTEAVNSTFEVERNEAYERSFPTYEQPRELTCYSIDSKRHVWFDDREMKYYYPPSGKDLNFGFKQFVQRDESVLEHIDTLLDALTHLNNTSEQKATADIITWRGILTKILCTPFNRKDAWELRATKHNGTIYIEEQSLKEKNSETDRMKLMSYWGYRFETLSTVSQPPHQAQKEELMKRNTESANTNIQYCVVVKTKLGNNSIIMGAEVDCCRDKKPPNPRNQMGNYVELKTSRIIETERHEFSFKRYKLLKFWAQSFLVGIPRVICGFRDDDGQIVEVKELKTLEMHRQVRDSKNMWNPSVCLNFANQVLDRIKQEVTIDDPTITYAIKYDPHLQKIHITCTDHKNVFITQRFLEGKTQHEIGGERAVAQTNVTL